MLRAVAIFLSHREACRPHRRKLLLLTIRESLSPRQAEYQTQEEFAQGVRALSDRAYCRDTPQLNLRRLRALCQSLEAQPIVFDPQPDSFDRQADGRWGLILF